MKKLSLESPASVGLMVNQVFAWRNLPLIIIALGIILRLVPYLSNRSLWLDESSLALNIVERTFGQLLQPLDYGQAAPIGFLLVERAFIDILGGGEYALRLFPLLAGLISLPLFYSLAKKSVAQESAIIALVFFACSPFLIYYSSEVKQYSLDVSLALLIYVVSMGLILKEKLHTWTLFLYGAIIATAIWFSHPSIFVITGSIIVMLVTFIKRKDQYSIIKLIVPCSMLGLSFLILYFCSLRHMTGDSMLLTYWQKSFMPFPPKSLSDLLWFPNKFFEIFRNPVKLSLPDLGAFVFIIGFWTNVSKRRRESYILISPILIALLASGLHKYPFAERLLLFIVPAMLLFISEGVWYIFKSTILEAKAVAITLIALMVLPPLLSAAYNLKNPRLVEDIKPVLAHLRDHRHDGDVVYIYYGALAAVKYYQKYYGLNDGNYIRGISSKDDWGGYIRDLSQIRGAERAWVVFSHIHRRRGIDEENLFLFFLDRMGKRLDAFKRPGATVYLYNLSEAVTSPVDTHVIGQGTIEEGRRSY